MSRRPICPDCYRQLKSRARFYDHVDNPGRGTLTGRLREGARERVCDRCGHAWWEPTEAEG